MWRRSECCLGGGESRGGGYFGGCVVWGIATSIRTVLLRREATFLVELEAEHQRAGEVPTPIWPIPTSNMSSLLDFCMSDA